jgi:hypothetical protein
VFPQRIVLVRFVRLVRGSQASRNALSGAHGFASCWYWAAVPTTGVCSPTTVFVLLNRNCKAAKFPFAMPRPVSLQGNCGALCRQAGNFPFHIIRCHTATPTTIPGGLAIRLSWLVHPKNGACMSMTSFRVIPFSIRMYLSATDEPGSIYPHFGASPCCSGCCYGIMMWCGSNLLTSNYSGLQTLPHGPDSTAQFFHLSPQKICALF